MLPDILPEAYLAGNIPMNVLVPNLWPEAHYQGTVEEVCWIFIYNMKLRRDKVEDKRVDRGTCNGRDLHGGARLLDN